MHRSWHSVFNGKSFFHSCHDITGQFTMTAFLAQLLCQGHCHLGYYMRLIGLYLCIKFEVSGSNRLDWYYETWVHLHTIFTLTLKFDWVKVTVKYIIEVLSICFTIIPSWKLINQMIFKLLYIKLKFATFKFGTQDAGRHWQG